MRRGSILENNIVQSMASTGESLATGVIITVPAIVMIGAWQDFEFWPTTLIVLLGGLLGVVFMVPMRRALIVERPDLVYPEGVACAEVLRTGDQGDTARLKSVGGGMLAGAVFTLCLRGIYMIKSTVENAWSAGGRTLYVGSDMSVALLGVGYIVGLRIAILITLGGVIGWWIAIPLLGHAPEGVTALDHAWQLWDTKVRYIGVGAMLVGGVHSLLSMRTGLVGGVRAMRAADASEQPIRTSQNLSLGYLAFVFLVTVLATFALFEFLTQEIGIASVTTAIMVLASFLLVAVATHLAGLVGSSHSPVSGMTICALMVTGGVLLALGISSDQAILATLGVAGVVCCATCTSGDLAQDLKTGMLLGATPRKQQSVELMATVVTAFFFAPILTLLHHAYGIGTGEEGALQAPQAGLFASLSSGLFGRSDIEWNMVKIGATIGMVLLVINKILEMNGKRFRAHIMPVAVGIYLPVSLDIPLLLGGLVRTLFSRNRSSAGGDKGLLFGSGLIAGEALMGILLAIPIAAGVALPWHLSDGGWWNGFVESGWLSIILGAAVVALFIHRARNRNG
jgi:putative OPT family oligopeptide transporter